MTRSNKFYWNVMAFVFAVLLANAFVQFINGGTWYWVLVIFAGSLGITRSIAYSKRNLPFWSKDVQKR